MSVALGALMLVLAAGVALAVLRIGNDQPNTFTAPWATRARTPSSGWG